MCGISLKMCRREFRELVRHDVLLVIGQRQVHIRQIDVAVLERVANAFLQVLYARKTQ